MDATLSLLDISPAQLRQAADLKERIDSLSQELSKILAGTGAPAVSGGGTVANGKPAGKRTMSAAGRARIAAAAKARWAKIRAGKGASVTSVPAPAKAGKKRTMSPAARAKIAAAARARWAKVRAAKA